MKRLYWILLFFLIVIFGSNYTVAKFALDYSTPLVFSMMRAGLGCAVTVPLSAYTVRSLRSKKTQQERKNLLRIDVKTICYIALYGTTSSTFFFGFWYTGETLTSASISSVIVNMSPLFTVLFAYFLRERVGRLQIAGLILGFLGAFLVVSNGSFNDLFVDWRGFVLLLLSAASFASSLIMYKRLLAGFEPISLNMLQLGFATIGLFAWVLISNAHSLLLVRFSETFVISLVYTTVFGSVISNLIVMALVRQKGPTWFSMWLFLSPVSGVAISSLVLGETFLPVQILGMFLVIASIYQISRSSPATQTKAVEPASSS